MVYLNSIDTSCLKFEVQHSNTFSFPKIFQSGAIETNVTKSRGKKPVWLKKKCKPIKKLNVSFFKIMIRFELYQGRRRHCHWKSTICMHSAKGIIWAFLWRCCNLGRFHPDCSTLSHWVIVSYWLDSYGFPLYFPIFSRNLMTFLDWDQPILP